MPGAIARPSKKGGRGPDPREDAFVETIERLVTWTRENLRAVLGGTVLLTVLVLGGLWYWNYQQSRAEQAGRRLQSIRNALAMGTDTVGVPRLEQFVQNFGGTEAAQEARVLLARLQMERGAAEEAIASVTPVVDATSAETPTGVAARRILAEAQEAAGRREAALRTLRDLAQNARFGFQRRQATAERAELLVEMGRLEEARKIYARLVEEAPDAETGQMYAVRLGEVRARMASDGDTASASTGSASGS